MAKAKAKSAPKSKSNVIDVFRAAHDPAVIIPTKIRKALAALAKEPISFAYEQSGNTQSPIPMVKRADVSTAHLAQYRKEFADHIVKVAQDTGSRRAPRLVWFGDPAVALEARGGPVNPADFE